MNKRRREILSRLGPAATFAMERAGKPRADVPGLTIRNQAGATELLIYGAIGGGGWMSDGITSSDVAALIQGVTGPLSVRINSNGGDVFQGVAIHTLLARHPGTVTVYVDGLAASAASFIMLAGDRIVCARNAMVMIHDGMTGTYGNQATHDRSSELLGKVSDNMADMYAERCGEDVDHWRALMTVNGEDGTWYTGQEALDAGLVDEITGTEDDEDETAALLSGWVDLLPATITANLKLPPDPVETVETAARWDPSKLTEILKGVLA